MSKQIRTGTRCFCCSKKYDSHFTTAIATVSIDEPGTDSVYNTYYICSKCADDLIDYIEHYKGRE